MQITKPTFYKEFSCIAGACPDTCCAGWQIMIDEKSLQKYRRFKGPFRNRLHNDIDWKEHSFCQYKFIFPSLRFFYFRYKLYSSPQNIPCELLKFSLSTQHYIPQHMDDSTFQNLLLISDSCCQ